VRLVGLAVKVAEFTPVPDMAMSTDVVDPLTVRDSSPVLGAAVVAAKLTLKVDA
jgi:hypothetical protein